MKTYLLRSIVTNRIITNRQSTEGLRQALDNSYRRLIEAARNEWERNFAGKEASDSCVSIRITGLDRFLLNV